MPEPHTLHGAPPETLAALLDDPADHDHPYAARLLVGLTPEQATHRFGAAHSIAEIVAHLNANLRFNLALAEGVEAVPVGWPPVTASDWPALADEHLTLLTRCVELAKTGDLDRVLFPATDSEPGWTLGYKLAASVAKHQSYHLGQIALLRRLLGMAQ